jgi:hypothetical protein
MRASGALLRQRHVRLRAAVVVGGGGGRFRWRLGIRTRPSAVLDVGEAHLDQIFAISFVSRPVLVLVLMGTSVLVMQSGRRRRAKGANLPRSSTAQPDESSMR